MATLASVAGGGAASLAAFNRISRRPPLFKSSSSSSVGVNNHRSTGISISTNAGAMKKMVVTMHAHGGEAGAATAHGHGHGGGARRPGENKGFVEEMRFVAMKLHTREQAPKEGEKKADPEQKPMAQWQPTKEGYLKFLVESKAVYDAMEEIVASGDSPIYAAFVDTGRIHRRGRKGKGARAWQTRGR